jgi:hypothetical protein
MDITTNPLVILAADVASGPVTVWTGNVHVRNIIFSQYTSINDFAQVNQTDGKFFSYLAAAADLESVKDNNVEWARGLVVPHGGITNGQLSIYIR